MKDYENRGYDIVDLAEINQYESPQGERPPIERFDFKEKRKKSRCKINLTELIRHSSEGVRA
jgi:hypothetical protein